MEFKEYTAKDAAVADGYAIRYLVFCQEDGFTQDEEFDHRDATAIHIVGYVGNKPVSNVRLVQESVGLWHLGSSNCQAKCNSLVEKVNRRNKVKTLPGAIVNQIKNSVKALS